MKIYETEDDGKIGDLLYKTVKFDKAELIAGGVTVISQGAVQRYLASERPDLKIKKCGSFKFDSQTDTVIMRIGIVDNKVEEDLKRIEAAANGECVAVSGKFMETKLLNPGYDELKKKYDELQNEKNIIGRLYDSLVIAVAKDAQKFSDLLVENEELRTALQLAQTYYENDEYHNMGKVFEQILKEDSADLTDAKEVIEGQGDESV